MPITLSTEQLRHVIGQHARLKFLGEKAKTDEKAAAEASRIRQSLDDLGISFSDAT